MAQKVIQQKEEVLKKEVNKLEVPKVEVAKVEIQKVEQQKETSFVSDSYIETLWGHVEGAVSRTGELREQSQELYLNAIKETTKFNGVYRKTLKGLFEQAIKLNSDFRKGFFQNSIMKTNESAQEVTESLKSQVNEAASKLEELYLTPINAAFDLSEKAEKLFEQNCEEFIEYTNEALNVWEAVTDNYLQQARKTHQDIAHRLEDSLRVLVAPGK
ncbi:poly(hydroxyalkanoate) inclusion protein PhaP [Neobacillus bataviensis]|uniref:Poly(Hydroxyalkanoate) inclusion protein PhaP n=1 Tax=Neobacillus bataviensis TaxID=220685 RepID=A0A561CFG7_9BACI|nr:hypothetical protein [Neobacillus bataviensis]TWD89608.1 poly(hydroxyalkanoate) inclusion protein PhaP [Neobacillus bataviensis]